MQYGHEVDVVAPRLHTLPRTRRAAVCSQQGEPAVLHSPRSLDGVRRGMTKHCGMTKCSGQNQRCASLRIPRQPPIRSYICTYAYVSRYLRTQGVDVAVGVGVDVHVGVDVDVDVDVSVDVGVDVDVDENVAVDVDVESATTTTTTTTTATATTTTMRRMRRAAFTVTTNAAFLGAPTPR